MLSGVGPADHLSSVGVPVVADLPGVGSHLKDHPVIDLSYMDNFKQSLNYLKPHNFTTTLKFIKALIQYQTTGSGPLATNVRLGKSAFHADVTTYSSLDCGGSRVHTNR